MHKSCVGEMWRLVKVNSFYEQIKNSSCWVVNGFLQHGERLRTMNLLNKGDFNKHDSFAVIIYRTHSTRFNV